MRDERNEWKVYLNEGEKYNQLSHKAIHRPEKFTPEIIFNIASMAIEKYFMAYFLKNNVLPPNHTIRDLVDYMKEVADCPKELEERLIYMDEFQEICSIEMYNRKIPTQEDIVEFVQTVTSVAEFINGAISAAA